MSVAIIETGGKQYLIREGDELTVERLTAEPQTVVTLPDLLHDGGQVTLEVIGPERAAKIHVRKFKAKTNYLKRRGHRQLLTRVRIQTVQPSPSS